MVFGTVPARGRRAGRPAELVSWSPSAASVSVQVVMSFTIAAATGQLYPPSGPGALTKITRYVKAFGTFTYCYGLHRPSSVTGFLRIGCIP